LFSIIAVLLLFAFRFSPADESASRRNVRARVVVDDRQARLAGAGPAPLLHKADNVPEPADREFVPRRRLHWRQPNDARAFADGATHHLRSFLTGVILFLFLARNHVFLSLS
jgi:hypothetical protein